MFTANGPAIVAELRGGPLDVSAEQLGAIVQPTLLIAGHDSPSAPAEVTKLMAAAMPAHPAVLALVDEVVAGR